MARIWNAIRNKLFPRRDHRETSVDLGLMMKEAHAKLVEEKYDEARHILVKALGLRDKIHDANAIDWMLEALSSTWLFQDRFEEQITFFSGYLTRYPVDFGACRGRAEALWYSGQLREAIDDYSRALDLQPIDLLSRSGRGQVLAQIRESAKAIEDLDIALRIIESAPNPDGAWREWHKDIEAFARNGRAMAIAYAGQIRGALEQFDASIALSPDNAWVYYNRARVHESAGDKNQVLSDYRTSLTKTKPKLTSLQKEHASERIQAISQSAP